MKKTGIKHLLTREGEALTQSAQNGYYPRPRMVRGSFFDLCGEWDFCTYKGKSDAHVPFPEVAEIIRVPFPPESRLSGICREIKSGDTLVYRRTFTLPEGFLGDDGRLLLHFGAVDQYATVYINGARVGSHEGGYAPFCFDITSSVLASGENEITVIARDELHNKILPYGKQRRDRGGMWYTPFSGIWQAVWLECVPQRFISRIEADFSDEDAFIKVFEDIDGIEHRAESITVTLDSGEVFYSETGGVCIKPAEKRLWSPEDPYLYYFTLTTETDSVRSYFALRKIETKEIGGIPRLCLNGKPYFFHGLLDQGYFSDGISTPASPVLFENDIRFIKSLGFNTLRKHIKVEPEQFYYDCDRLGVVVFQDMVNNSGYSFLRDTALPTIGMKKLSDRHLHMGKKSREAFTKSAKETVSRLKNHPSVLYFTIFNEGWGQFESERLYSIIKFLAPTHIIDTVSGWFEGATSDVTSPHVYFKPVRIKKGEKPVILSEFGGYSHSIEGHVSNPKKIYGYKVLSSLPELENALTELYEKEIIPAVKEGLCGAILTQLSDVEDETNGLITYDRKIEKVTAEKFLPIAEKLAREIEK